MTLRDLLIQRAARLQEGPALTAPGWDTLSYARFRNRVEGIALGLLAEEPAPALSCRTGTAWDWAAEVAAACCGLRWDPAAPPLDPRLLGGDRFNDEGGRQAYHDRGEAFQDSAPFAGGLDQGEVLGRLRRLNGLLGWDHAWTLRLPPSALGTPEGRAALWSALYGGSHAILDPAPARGLFRRRPVEAFDPAPFQGFWRP